MENSVLEHLSGVKQILRYIKGTINNGVLYMKGDTNCDLIGFSDGDFARDINDQRSTSSQIFFLSGRLVNWTSQKQIVALSSCEVEYISAMAAACQGVRMNQLISEMKGEEPTDVRLMVDN